MERLELKDFLNYKFLSQVRHSPDGTKAALVVADCNEEENCYESRLWLYEAGGLRQLTDLGKERSFYWEDDSHILFPAVRSSGEQKRSEAKEQFTSFYRLNLGGGEALPAFTLPFSGAEIRHLKDSLWLAVGDVDANCPDYAALSAEDRAAYAKAQEEEQDYEVFDEAPFWFNGQGVTNKRRRGLFLCDVAAGTVRRVTPPLFNLEHYLVLEDQVLYAGAEWQGLASWDRFDLYSLNPDTGDTRLIRAYNLSEGGLYQVGDRVVLLASEGKRHGLNENYWFYTLNPDTGELAVLREEEFGLGSSVGSDCRYGGGKSLMTRGDRLYFTTTREGDSHLYCLNLSGESWGVVTKSGSIDCFSVNEHSGKALLVGLYGNRLQELYEADLTTGEVERVSAFNDAALAGKYIAQPQPMTIQSQGWEIGGWVLEPKDYDPARTYPAVLDIHGGPKTVYGSVFYHEMQVWANLGYFVFFCNPMGSDGRDNTFMDIRGHYGDTDYRNLMDFTDAVLERYPQIDRERVCVTGGSYGGFMTNWIIGHTDRFCCAASQRSIANWLSFYGVSDIGVEFSADQCDANPFDSPEQMWAHSPMKYAANAKTPTLFIHSDEDYRCPLAEGLQMYTSLVAHGVPARLCLFHGENHELSRSGKPKHRVRRLTEITNWFETYSKNRA